MFDKSELQRCVLVSFTGEKHKYVLLLPKNAIYHVADRQCLSVIEQHAMNRTLPCTKVAFYRANSRGHIFFDRASNEIKMKEVLTAPPDKSAIL